jgi:hypothetical protein
MPLPYPTGPSSAAPENEEDYDNSFHERKEQLRELWVVKRLNTSSLPFFSCWKSFIYPVHA